MEQAGALCLRHYRTLAFMGFWEVLKNAGTIRQLFRECTAEIDAFRPDVFVGIDYPGFNLRMAQKAHALGIRTHHYISPSVWAWKKNRVKNIQRDVDHLHVILPFENSGMPTRDWTFIGWGIRCWNCSLLSTALMPRRSVSRGKSHSCCCSQDPENKSWTTCFQ